MSLLLPLGTAAASVAGNFATVLIFVLVGFVFAGIALGVAKLLRPSNPSPTKMTTYECGEIPTGSSWVRFNVRFYLVALFFLVFDVEVVFLFPWAVVFKQLFPIPELGALVFWEMVIFLGILTMGQFVPLAATSGAITEVALIDGVTGDVLWADVKSGVLNAAVADNAMDTLPHDVDPG